MLVSPRFLIAPLVLALAGCAASPAASAVSAAVGSPPAQASVPPEPSAAPTTNAPAPAVPTHMALGSPVDLGPATVTLLSESLGNVDDGSGNIVGGTYFTFKLTAHMNDAPCYSLADVYVLAGGTRQPGATSLARNATECTELNAGETGYQVIGFPFFTSQAARPAGSPPLTVVLAPGGPPLASWDFYPGGTAASSGAEPSTAAATATSTPSSSWD